MESDELAFLRAIEANPADDLPRLVYADWLQEHGHDIRAEFIRVQCEIAKLEVGPRDVVDANWKLWKRQQDLLDEHRELFIPNCLQDLNETNYILKRGFVESIHVSASWYCQHYSLVFVLKPFPTIHISELINDLSDFLSLPASALEVIESLQANFMEDIEFDRDVLADSALYPLLMEAMPHFTNLQELNLDECYIRDEGLRVFELGALPKLKRLRLRFNLITDVGLIELLNMGFLQRLELIDLSVNNLSDQSAFELADRLARSEILKHLVLRNNGFTPAGQSALLNRFGSRVDLF